MPFFTALGVSAATGWAATSVGLSAVGAYGAAKDKKNTASYNAAVQRNNAEIAEMNADDVRDRGEQAAQDRGAQIRQTIGAAKAAMAGNGVLVDDGVGTTPAALLQDLATAGAIDITRLREAASREEHRALVQGSNFEAQAGLFEQQSRSINPMLAGFSAGARGAVSNSNTLFD